MGCELQELLDYAGQLLRVREFPQDPFVNGIHVEGKQTVQSIGVGVTASVSVIEQAVQAGVDLLFVHHGLVLQNKTAAVRGVFAKKVRLLLEHNVTLLGYHLPLDACQEYGNNWPVGRIFPDARCEPFAVQGIEVGVLVRFSRLPRTKFAQMLGDFYQHPAVTVFGGKEQVSSVVIVSGYGYKYMQEAAGKADCFVTGSYDLAAWNMAMEEGMNFFAYGHSATEKVGVKLFGEHLASHFSLRCEFFDDGNLF